MDNENTAQGAIKDVIYSQLIMNGFEGKFMYGQ
jgi:hypothetical protein